MGHTHRYQFGFKKKSGKESQYLFLHLELDSDPPIGSNRESRHDKNPRPELLHTNLSISLMAEPSTLIPNLNEIMEEHAQPEGEVHLEPTGEVHLETTEENRPSEQPEVQPVVRQ